MRIPYDENNFSLIGTYIRTDDDAIMVEVSPGWFVKRPDSVGRKSDEDVSEEGACGPTELESLEQSMAESPKNISRKYVREELKRLFQPNETLVSTIMKDGAVFIDGKRKFASKPKCNLEISTARPDIQSGLTTEFKEQARRGDTWVPAGRLFRYRVASELRQTLALLPSFFVCIITPPGLVDTTREASRNRAKIEKYNFEFPEKD